jgi:hypothetical protein
MNISPFLSVNQSCDEALQWAEKQLQRANLRAVQTFDLHAARARLHDCPCPNHGTEQCDCQMVVLLVYGKSTEPETLILHGSDGRTWISIAETPSQPAQTNAMIAIKNALEGKLSPII